MIKFSGTNRDTNTPLLGIGLSRANCEALLAGRPIRFSTLGMEGLPTVEILIMAGETETTMARELVEMGAISQADIREDKSLADPYVPLNKKEIN